jgi:tetratricopeptide (TPR) repeat protein
VILTGLPPYVGPEAEAVRVMAIRGDLSACLARLEGCGAEPELVALCKRCLAFAPGERPRDGGAVAAEIARLRAAAEERARTAETERAAAEARTAEQRRKRRWQLAAAGTVVLALLAGLGGLGLYLRAQARANADLQAANQREHERFQLALDAIKTFHTGVSEDALLKEEQFKGLRERLLREAAGFYGKLQALLEDQPDPSSQRALAESYFLLADLTDKIGSLDEAIAGHRRALGLRRQLAARGEPGADLEVARSLLALASLLQVRGDDAGMRAALDEALSLAEAAGESDEALDLRAESHSLLGDMSFQNREWKELLRQDEQELKIRQQLADANPGDAARQRKLAHAYNGFGIALKYQQRYPESLQAYEKAIDIFEKEANANPGDAGLHGELARAHNNKGQLLIATGREKEAVSECVQALDSMQRGIDVNPAVSEHRNNLAFFGNNLGDLLYYDLGRYEEALQVYRRSANALQPVVDVRSTNIYYLDNLAKSHTGIGSVLVVLGRPGEALPEFDKALLHARKVAAALPKETPTLIARLARERGKALQKLGQLPEAVASFREAIRIWKRMWKPKPDDQYDLASSYALLYGAALEKESGLTMMEADEVGEHAVAVLRRAIDAGYRDLATMSKDTDLDSLRKRPDFEKVLKELEEKMAADHPKGEAHSGPNKE